MQQRPLLDDGADHDTSSASAAASATRQPPPLALHEPRALNAGKPKTARRLTPLRFCLGLLALIGLVGAGLLGWGAVSLGRLLYASFSHPHAGHRLNQTLAAAAGVPESDLVRSYFSPDGGSSHETFDLGALVYARWDEVPQPKAGRKKATDGADDETEPALDLSWLDERMGIKPAPPERTDWQLVHRSIVLKDVPVSTKPVQSIVQVTVPKDLVCVHPALDCASRRILAPLIAAVRILLCARQALARRPVAAPGDDGLVRRAPALGQRLRPAHQGPHDALRDGPVYGRGLPDERRPAAAMDSLPGRQRRVEPVRRLLFARGRAQRAPARARQARRGGPGLAHVRRHDALVGHDGARLFRLQVSCRSPSACPAPAPCRG